MKLIHLVALLIISLFSSFAYASTVPSVAQVESSIASGDYKESRELLKEVLKVNPDSYVANRYMFEIVKIENGRDNTPSVEYKLYEDRIKKIEQQTEERRIAEKKAKIHKFIKTVLYSFLLLIIIGALSYFGYFKYKKYLVRQKENKKLKQWCSETTADLLDIQNSLVNTKSISFTEHKKSLLNDLIADNEDAMQQVLLSDVNTFAIEKHIYNAKNFLRK